MKKWLAVLAIGAFLASPLIIAWAAGQEPAAEKAHPPETKGKTLKGQLVHIEGWHYTVKNFEGQEISFGVTGATKLSSTVKEGDFVVAMIGDDNIATSLKNLKKSGSPPQ